MGPAFPFSRRRMASFWIRHLTLVSHVEFDFIPTGIGLFDEARALGVADELAADGANPLAAGRAQGLRREGQVQLLEDDGPQVELTAAVVHLVELLVGQLLGQGVELLGEVDEVELAGHGEFERDQAARADEAQLGRDLAPDEDLLADEADGDLGVGRLEEDGILLDQVQVQELEIPGQAEAFLRQAVDIDQHRRVQMIILEKISSYYTKWDPVVKFARAAIIERSSNLF